MTRAELANVCTLCLNINRDDKGNMDVDEVHQGYQAYLKYIEIVEKQILDLMEKFQVNITKKIEDQEQMG